MHIYIGTSYDGTYCIKEASHDAKLRLEKSKAAALKEVTLQKTMGEVVKDKLQTAEARKKILMKEAVNKLSSSASKNDLSPRPRDGTSLTIADIESKINGAAERRETFLATRSSSSKRVHSPRPGPSASLTVDIICLLYTSPSPRDLSTSRMPSSA